jgi:hypothetical protein
MLIYGECEPGSGQEEGEIKTFASALCYNFSAFPRKPGSLLFGFGCLHFELYLLEKDKYSLLHNYCFVW